MAQRCLVILGIRGVPAAHGGFETFAERLSLHLADRGWRVVVYCQVDGDHPGGEDEWQGVHRVFVPVRAAGALGTILFDVKAIAHAMRRPGLLLTLGYNTGFLSLLPRLLGRPNIINMDGVEWKRAKYSRPAQAFLWINERLAAVAGNTLVADHPSIADHLCRGRPTAKIATIPYGGDQVETADPRLLTALGLDPDRYLTLIARPEPENSILEIVRAFSSRRRGVTLAVLGSYDRRNAYHAAVRGAASDEVVFTGAIYDREVLRALRLHSIAYLHGHRVGGTNPSLVEALGAGNAVIAHDNRFNRWVSGRAALYFTDEEACGAHISRLCEDPGLRAALRARARERWAGGFTWDDVLRQYEALFLRHMPAPFPAVPGPGILPVPAIG